VRSEAIYVWVLAVIFGVTLGSWIYVNYVFVEIKVIPMDIKVMNKVGLNSDTDALHFGKNFQGGAGMRMIQLTNNNDVPVRVNIVNKGNFSTWVTISENYSKILPGENSSIYYYVNVPIDAQLGYYNGTSTVIIRRMLWT
jgi:hypothetical protein